ncbi:TPA: conjugal transfer protein TrbF, partial [Klebsiella pneumoniae]
MNKYIRSTGLYAFLFPASLKDSGQTAAEKIEQLKPEFIHRERR